MPDIRPVTDAFAVAPQLSLVDIAAAAGLGYRSLINNRPDGEAPGQPSGDEVREAAKSAGLAYFEIPVRGGPSADQVRQTSEVISSAPGPILAFCRSGTRSIVTWALSQRETLPRDELIALGEKAGYDLGSMLP
jgi:uncharacterized protein (TIGR01244 family)